MEVLVVVLVTVGLDVMNGVGVSDAVTEGLEVTSDERVLLGLRV